MVSARPVLSTAEAGDITRATAAIAAMRAACTICTARTPLPRYVGLRTSNLNIRASSAMLERPGSADFETAVGERLKAGCSAVHASAPASRNLLEIGLECDHETSGFAARHNAMV